MLTRFGKFELDSRRYELTCEGRAVRLERIPLKLLFFLTESKGALVSRQAIAEHLWGKDVFVDAQHSVNTAINKLRAALRDDSAEPKFIQTVKGMGYRFVAEVEISSGEPPVPEAQPSTLTPSNGNRRETVNLVTGQSTAVITPADFAATATVPSRLDPDRPIESSNSRQLGNSFPASSSGNGTPAIAVADVPKLRPAGVAKLAKFAVPVLLAALLVAGKLYYRVRRPSPLGDRDTIVLADFANSTGDEVFDDTLKTALNVSLRQSPFLNVLPDSQFAQTLKLMERPAGAKLTPEVTRELCQRVGSKAYVAGSIVSLGSQYVLELKAVNCRNGDPLAEEQVTATSKEKVLDALGEAASKLRTELGESLATVQKFDVPLEQATTSSLEALQAYSKTQRGKNQIGDGISYNQRAIELDPNFAMAYASLGATYLELGEPARAREYFTKAFQLRDHASTREKLEITAEYYQNVTGELDKAARNYQEEVESYPGLGYVNLGNVYAEQGQFEKAAEMTRQYMRLAPEKAYSYVNLANFDLALQRFDDARQILREAQARGMNPILIHPTLYALAFLGADRAGMAEQQQWIANQPEYENFGLSLASDTEAYAGHLGKALELTKRAVDSAIRVDDKENGAVWQAIAAQREAAYGNAQSARQLAAQALNLARVSPAVESEAALAFAMAGDGARAESLAQELEKLFPLGTQVQSIWLPAIRAQLAINRGNPLAAIESLQSAPPIDSGQIMFVMNISCLYPVYVRGEAYLAGGQGSAAAVEFQKILDHTGMVWNCWTGALAHLGFARASALESRSSQGANAAAARTRALAAYADFLTLWNDADSNIPIYKQAMAEYAKLQ